MSLNIGRYVHVSTSSMVDGILTNSNSIILSSMLSVVGLIFKCVQRVMDLSRPPTQELALMLVAGFVQLCGPLTVDLRPRVQVIS